MTGGETIYGSHPPEQERREELLQEYVDRLNAGERIDPEEIRREHPSLAEGLIEDLQAFAALDAAGLGAGPFAEEAPLGTLGDYVLRRRIGRGGMGVVYDAWQGSLDRSVALKVLPSGVAADSKAFLRFMREAKTAAQLSHPNIVAVYGMGVEQNTPYYSMELVEGETLAQILRREPPAPEAFQAHCLRMAAAFADVADGLQHAHSKGVVHRDLKPSNLILDREGRLRILDFGLARLEGQEALTASGELLGTPLYMSPEQARRRKVPVDHRTDIYSLGATLYEMLTWRPPFQGKDREDTLSQIIERDPPEPRQLNPRVPRDIETIVLKCLRKDPADRYGTAEALGQDLRRFVRGDPVEAKPQGKWERILRRIARQKVRLLVSAGAAVLLPACAILAWRLSVEKAKERAREYERAVVAAAMKLLRGETVLAGVQGIPAERVSFLPGEYKAVFDESARAAVEQALSDLDRALKLLPERFEAHYHRGRALLMLERGREAVREFDEALRTRPGFAPAFVLKAEALGAGEDPSLAEDPRGEAWSRARRAMKNSRFDEAAAAYRDLIALEEAAGELYPGSGIAHLLARGAARILVGEFEAAILDSWAARTLSRISWGDLLEPHLLLGMAYFLRANPGDLDRAEESLREAASLTASEEEGALWPAAVYSFLVWRCSSLGRLPDAVEAARRAVRLRPRELKTRLSLGWALLGALWVREWGEGGARAGQDDAEEWLKELVALVQSALDLDPTSPAAHYLMGKGHAARGDHDKARSFFQRAQQLQEAQVSQGGSDMKNAMARPAVAAASLVVALSGAGKTQEGYFEDVMPVESPVNSPFGEAHPGLSDDGLELFFVSYRPGGKGRGDLYVAWRSARDDPWGSMRYLEGLSTPGFERDPSISADGLTLYFESDGLGGAGGIHICVARRERRWEIDKDGSLVPAHFGNPEILVELNSSYQDGNPNISKDGLELFFVSNRPGGQGNWDLFVATRLSTGERFGEPKPLVNLNTGDWENHLSISCDGLTLFFSRASSASPANSGKVFLARRESREAEFGNPEPLGRPVNTGDLWWGGQPDISCDWPADGAVLHFVRAVGGVPQIYRATWRLIEPPPARFLRGDANGQSGIDLADAIFILNYLFADGPAPGCLDAADTNDDSRLDIGDGITVLGHLFASTGPLPEPFPQCGLNPSGDALACERYTACP